MAKFCGKCGAKLDEQTGKCPNCDKVAMSENHQIDNGIDEDNQSSTKINPNDKVNKELSKRDVKATKKAEKKAAKKAKRKKHIFLRIVAILLCLAILSSGVSGVLVYFDIVDIPFVSSVMELLGLVDKNEIADDNLQITGKFSNVKVVDGNSAIEAVEDVSEQIKLDNATEELTVKSINTIDGITYYRLQQNYKGYPVYGRTIVVIADANGDTQGLTSNAKNISDFDLTYSFNKEKIKSSIIEFLENNYSYDNISDVVITAPKKEDLQIYEIDNRDEAVLVYVSNVQFVSNGQKKTISLIVDVSNVNVIDTTQTIYSDSAICYGQNGSVSFLGLQLSEEKYLMKDVERNIYIYNGGKQEVFDDNYLAQVNIVNEVTSKDNIFGNDNENDDPLNYNIATTFLVNLSRIYDFYDSKYDETALGVLLGIYNDNFDSGNNALGGTVDISSIVSTGMPDYDSSLTNGKTGLVSMGTNTGVACIDTMAHEYTHFVTRCNVDWAERKKLKYDYTGAINEAYSDIFGEIIEGYITEKKPDWVHGDRIIYDPSINNYPENVDDGRKIYELTNGSYGYEVKSSNGETYYTDYSHGHSTAISYAAYLMNAGGSSEENLTIDELADLWYRTMLTLPSNCTYSVLRENMEMTAEILGFSQQKRELISRTFDTVGIYDEKEKEVSKYSTNSSVSAFDYNGNLYDNYKIIVDGTKNIALWGLFKEPYHDEISVVNADPAQLELPKGTYTISVTDGINTYSKQIKARSNSENTELNFVTNFGYQNKDNENITNGQFDNLDLLDGAVEFNDHWYKVIENSSITDWNEAQQYCTLLNGYLATITSKAENDFIYNYLTSDIGYESAYIGFSDHLNEGDWQWVTGEEVTYTNWHQNEPNGESSNEDYGMFYYKYSDGTWNDGDFGNRTINGGTVFICEWGEYQALSSVPTEPVRTTSDERDIVLVLDTSGSMSGTPIEEVKKASTSFVSTILKEDASIGVVTYESSATMISDFSVNENYLKNAVSSIGSGGGTNIESGLLKAEEMLRSSNAKKKIIVLMSDGAPGSGKVGDELIAYADTIKEQGIYIYTLGFFESMGGSKSSAQILMEGIASEGCHYEVADADNLVFFFGDIADQINGQKYIYVRIACPVDVTVTYNGETLCSIEDELSTRTAFGSLTFEENEEKATDSTDNRIKILRLKEGTDYDIQIEGNGRGRMNYTIGFMDETGEYSDLRKFTNIKITKRTVIDTIATASNSTVLNVDEDGDGKYDIKYKATENGRGEIVDYTYLVYVAIGVVVLIGILIVVAKIRKRSKKNA